ncbi:hypothetical protein BJP25_05355 [Actinokineospora bangkokensis]|uniref:Uncharacterized protein n=1 Tax=Actinokineospora bangkokensis TaxID=1193682 RepID=A0A1Q9LBV5_9PSEU|nr:hypothetical protein BJP25_05355 [Actinokineospora bangkokensis]
MGASRKATYRPGLRRVGRMSANAATPPSDRAKITTPIATALPCPPAPPSPRPPRPTSGAASPPTTNWSTPSSAAADPARLPWSARASAVEFGVTMPTLATTTNSPGSSAASPSSPSTAASTSAAPTAELSSPPVSNLRGSNRRSSNPLSWLTSTMPSAFRLNTALYSCGLSPCTSCSTNDDPEM